MKWKFMLNMRISHLIVILLDGSGKLWKIFQRKWKLTFYSSWQVYFSYYIGSYKVPFGGFKDYPITINKLLNCPNFLPVSHTCFSIIDLPEYSSQEKLTKQLKTAIDEGKGFSVSWFNEPYILKLKDFLSNYI